MIKLKYTCTLVILLNSQISLHAGEKNLNNPSNSNNPQTVANASLNYPCGQEMRSGDYQKALEVCDEELEAILLKTNASESDKRKSLRLRLDLAEIHHFLGNVEREASFLAQVKEHPQFESYPDIQYRWLRKMGQRYYFSEPSILNIWV